MTKFLATALKQNNPIFYQGLRKANLITNKDNNDIYFTEHIKKLTRNKIKALSLDPLDTLPIELYKSLQEKLKQDEVQLIRSLRYLAASKISAEADLISGLILKLTQLMDNKTILAIKPAILKKIIKHNKPNKTMKVLGYRSLDSMLKRETVFNILFVIKMIESKALNNKLLEDYKKLTINDFILIPIKFEVIKKFKNIEESSGQNIVGSIFETATVGIADISSTIKPGLVVKIVTDIIDELEIWYVKNDLLDIMKFNSDFGNIYKIILENSSNDLLELVKMSGLNNLDSELAYEQSQDLLLYQDNKVKFNKISNMLAGDNMFSFWHNTDYLIEVCKNEIVSFNVKDLANDLLSLANFATRSTVYARDSLKRELLLQYFKPVKFVDYITSLLQINKDNNLKQIFIN